MPKAFDPDLGYVPCGKLHNLSDIERCTEPEGHEKRALQQARATRSRPSGNRLPEESDKQRERTAFLKGIKAERLRAIGERRTQMSEGGWPPYRCESCGLVFDTIEEAWAELTISHIEPRNDSASRYERRREPDFRGDDPTNILVECWPCNRAREPQPEFSS